MKIRALMFVAVAAAILLTPLHVRSQDVGEQEPGADPLAPFARLMGGQWHLGGSYQEFEWGVGRQSVKSRGYFLVGGEPKLVSEGIWFWHPGQKQIKGYFTAIDMPVVFFDYTTRFEKDKMISELRSYGLKGNETAYVETWEFKDDKHYVWKLFRQTPEGMKEEMGGTYTKR